MIVLNAPDVVSFEPDTCVCTSSVQESDPESISSPISPVQSDARRSPSSATRTSKRQCTSAASSALNRACLAPASNVDLALLDLPADLPATYSLERASENDINAHSKRQYTQPSHQNPDCRYIESSKYQEKEEEKDLSTYPKDAGAL
jgi:hypothetical protein